MNKIDEPDVEKAPAHVFATAKGEAMRAIANVEWDAPVPDMVRFFDDDGFIIRLSHGDNHVQKVMSWAELERARAPIIKEVVRTMLEMLARADFDA